MMSSEERGAVVAWHRRKLPFWPNASLFGHRDFVPPTQEGKSPMWIYQRLLRRSRINQEPGNPKEPDADTEEFERDTPQ